MEPPTLTPPPNLPPNQPGAAPTQQAPVQPPAAELPPPMHPALHFFQLPWVQNVLPFVTSLALHAAVIIVGFVAVKTVQMVVDAKPLEEQIIVPSSDLVDDAVAGGVQNVGLGGDPTRPPAQDEYPEGAEGWAPKPGDKNATAALMGGGSDDSSDPLIGLSAVGGGSGAARASARAPAKDAARAPATAEARFPPLARPAAAASASRPSSWAPAATPSPSSSSATPPDP